MADFIELAFVIAIVAIVFGARLAPRLADFIAGQPPERTAAGHPRPDAPDAESGDSDSHAPDDAVNKQ